MNIGKMRHKVTIQKDDGAGNDGGGNVVANWVDVATVWAQVTPMSADVRQAGQDMHQITHTVTIRYRNDINSAMRFNFNGRILDIKHIKNVDERNQELQITCIEG
jgi:SPP1 family predicted phage head-tail adaptor